MSGNTEKDLGQGYKFEVTTTELYFKARTLGKISNGVREDKRSRD